MASGSASTRRAAFLLVAAGLGGLGSSACHEGGPRARAEAAALRRQSQTLRRLLAATEKEDLFSSRRITVGIRQELVRDLLQLNLPVETVVARELRVRLEKAEVTFEGGESRVTMHGRVSRTQSAETFADLTVVGGLHRFAVGEPAGTLTAHVALDRLEVRRVEGAQSELFEGLLERLGEPGLASLAELVPPLALPVRFERLVVFEGVKIGPMEVAPARLSLRFMVAEVVALGGRLWVDLDVATVPRKSGGVESGGP